VKKLLAALMAMFSLACSAKEPMLVDINKAEADAWALTCLFSAYDCSQVKPPKVLYEPMSAYREGYHDYGSPYVYVNVNLLGTLHSKAVMVHEMIHYLQHKQKAPKNRCLREAEAFNLTYTITRFFGYNDVDSPAWPTMMGQYGCLPKFSATSSPAQSAR
jgi:hypothetical protein